MDKKTLWKAVLAELEVDISNLNFTMWLKHTSLEDVSVVDKKRQIVKLACRTPYQKNMVETRYYGQIKTVLDKLTEKENELVFSLEKRVDKNSTPAGSLFEKPKANEPNMSAYEEAVEKIRLRPEFTLDTFAVNSTNEMAHAAASAVARTPGEAYHLLFLYGGVGVGKTHLMNAVAHEILRAKPESEMVYCSGEEFMNELVHAIQSKNTHKFKSKYRKIDALLVDDIQFIAGKDAVQEEFFHTFNAIVQNKGQILLTSDRLPEEMVLLEDRLRSRFEGGLTIDIQEPDLELRTAIINIKAKARGVKLSMDVARQIAARVKGTRKLEGFLARLITQSNARNEPITMETVDGILGMNPEEESRPKKYVPPIEVINIVAEYFSLKPSLLKGKKRNKEVVQARHMAMYLLRKEFEMPLKDVGRFFGGRDHTTVMQAEEKMGRAIPLSEKVREDFYEVKKRVFGSV